MSKKRSQTAPKSQLLAETQALLKTLGEDLKLARIRRELTGSDLAKRMGVDRRTLTNLEKGNPSVSLGVFLQATTLLNLSKGLEAAFHAENDIEAASQEIRKIRKQKNRSRRVIPDEKVKF